MFSAFCWLSLVLIVWPRLSDPSASENPRKLCTSRSSEGIPGCAYTISSHGQIPISFTLPNWSHSTSSCVYPYTLFAWICCIRLLFEWSFHLHHHITFICYFVVSYLLILLPCHIGPFGVVLCCSLKRFRFPFKVSLSQSCVSFLVLCLVPLLIFSNAHFLRPIPYAVRILLLLLLLLLLLVVVVVVVVVVIYS